ncbi:hypothetical protein [Rhizobium leguminosarum]|nr:hypothetical protein [Rhizobium leguminosarum]
MIENARTIDIAAEVGGTRTSWYPVFAFPNARICWFMGERRDPRLLDRLTSARNAARVLERVGIEELASPVSCLTLKPGFRSKAISAHVQKEPKGRLWDINPQYRKK